MRLPSSLCFAGGLVGAFADCLRIANHGSNIMPACDRCASVAFFRARHVAATNAPIEWPVQEYAVSLLVISLVALLLLARDDSSVAPAEFSALGWIAPAVAIYHPGPQIGNDKSVILRPPYQLDAPDASLTRADERYRLPVYEVGASRQRPLRI